MAVNSNLLGKTFFANQISIGSTSGTDPFVFTESRLVSDQVVLGTPIGPGASATITSVVTNAGTTTVTAVLSNAGLASGQTISGTVIANDLTNFVVFGSAAGSSGTFLVTNTAAQQPGVGNKLSVPAESANVTYVPACYCAGTLIRTDRGVVAVESLTIGDRVETVAGAFEPIRWIGRRSYGGRFLASHRDLMPIRFRAGSLGDGVPSRDLLVSPKHAMLLDSVLVAAELLVNGRTVVQESALSQVDYYHIELVAHDVIWAEDAASETFVDDDSRGMFHNAGTFAALYPDATVGAAVYCAPRLTDGPRLEAIRRAIDGGGPADSVAA